VPSARREETPKKLAELVESYNQLMHDQRYAEADAVVKQATTLAPDDPTVAILRNVHGLVGNAEISKYTVEDKESGSIREMQSTDLAAAPPPADARLVYPDASDWNALTSRRNRTAMPSSPTAPFPLYAAVPSAAMPSSPTAHFPPYEAIPDARTVQAPAATTLGIAKPFSNYAASPAVSPWMNLYRNGTANGTIDNYTTLVRPELAQQAAGQNWNSPTGGPQNSVLQQRQPAMGGRGQEIPLGPGLANPNAFITYPQTYRGYSAALPPSSAGGVMSGYAIAGTAGGVSPHGTQYPVPSTEYSVLGTASIGSGSGTNANLSVAAAGMPGDRQVAFDDGIMGTYVGGRLVKAGPGPLTLSATNTYSGGTSVAFGTLAVAGGNLANPAGVSATSGATLPTLELSGGTFNAGGTLNLSTANSYNGGTTLTANTAGTLTVNDATLDGSSAYGPVGSEAEIANRIGAAADMSVMMGHQQQKSRVVGQTGTYNLTASGGRAIDLGGATPASGSNVGLETVRAATVPQNWAIDARMSEREGERSGKTGKGKKHLETWKPSGLVPNTSRLMVGDNEELPLRGMQVEVRIDGFRARVVLDLFYFNDQPRQLEGSFQLRLPQEASPYFFAFGRSVYQAPRVEPPDSMFFKREQVAKADTTPEEILALRRGSWEEPKVARMVPRETAAFAYRETVRRRVDPALVEWSGAGVFQCRVFPLAANSLHRVVIGYDVDLLRVGDDLELRLDLPAETPAAVVDFNIAAKGERQVSLDAPATPSPPTPLRAPTEGWSGARGATDGRLAYRLVNPKERPIIVRLREPGQVMLTSDGGKPSGYFATRLTLPLPDARAGTPPAAALPDGGGKAVFLVDTSLSAGPQFPLWTKLLRAVLENNRDRIEQFAVLFFNVETFWWQEQFVPNTPENVAALMSYADSLALEGATDLGHALAEAASPAWLKRGDGAAPDLFLLSDGAATWGEDRWPLLAAGLKGPSPRPSPGGRGGPVLFAYQTGMAGGDVRLLAHLAEQTGGAVFAVLGEAQIARASTAHRTLPWRLTGVAMAGGHDLLVAGRPQFVFPHQELLLVGRCEPNLNSAEVVFTLRRGQATQRVTVKMDRILGSELAERTYGQVAVGQLEDLAEAARPIATAYARHFRVTGQTCSLLMLESEQDYARFQIKPEEDAFVVKDRPASAVVAKAVAGVAKALGDPKAAFLAWFRGLEQNSEVHFDLPSSLGVALEGLPGEAFAVAVPPLRCKVRTRQELPEGMRHLWTLGSPDYEALAAESQRRLERYGADDALRAVSSLVEDRPGDAALARDIAFTAMHWGLPAQAYHLLRRAATARTFEPISFLALAHCLEQAGNADLAIVYYELACGGRWDGRFGDFHNIAQFDYCRFLRRLADGRLRGNLRGFAQARLATLTAAQVRDTADLVALIFWNTDGTDVDLHVTEPGGEECYYQHRQTASGGQLSQDVTTGYGPEIYILPRAPAGAYSVRAHYFASDANRASTRTKVFALIYRGWGTQEEQVTGKALLLGGRSEMHELANVLIGGPGGRNPWPAK
jgi:autotransporter-associated beta strand protein